MPPPRPVKRPGKNAVAAAIRTLEAAQTLLHYLTDQELDELLAPIIDDMPPPGPGDDFVNDTLSLYFIRMDRYTHDPRSGRFVRAQQIRA